MVSSLLAVLIRHLGLDITIIRSVGVSIAWGFQYPKLNFSGILLKKGIVGFYRVSASKYLIGL